ncbi:MAG: hypothetical protein P1U89_08510 [Verrucomicrobiales bacterium]|nr:hypothetical protein [Verrucomicrobiales bacterium]
MQSRNRYRNPVRMVPIIRVVFICLLLGVVGGVFVYLRNQHVQRGDEIRSVEIEIAELDREIQLWVLRIANSKDRVELNRRLDWQNSDLRSISPANILKIESSP